MMSQVDNSDNKQRKLPIVPRWLEAARLADKNPEAIAADWRQYYDCHGLNWRGCLDWVSPAWEGSDEAYDEFRSLMWRAWDFFRGNYRNVDQAQLAKGEASAAQSSPGFRRCYLGIYATLSAYSHLLDEASACYDRRFRYRDLPRRYREQAEAPLCQNLRPLDTRWRRHSPTSQAYSASRGLDPRL